MPTKFPNFLAAALLALSGSGALSQPLAPTEVSASKGDPNGKWSPRPTHSLRTLLPSFNPEPPPPLSPFGGSRPPSQKASGFFRTEKIGPRWCLVDPEGCRFLSVGVVNLSGPKKRETAKSKLTSEAWAAKTLPFIREQGFNSAGAWSDTELLRKSSPPIPYTRIWNFMSSYGKKRGGTFQKAGHTGYPEDCIFVFDPAFEQFCDEHAKQLALSKDDPWLLGHFSDNELPFGSKSLDSFLKLPDQDPGRLAAERWLKQRAPNETPSQITDGLRQEFLGFLIDTYLRITTTAMRKHDPNHLQFGSRFHGAELKSRAAFEAAGRHLDAVAINYYGAWSPDPKLMEMWANASGKPFLITEFYAKGMDSGLANTGGAGWVVKTQAERGLFYENFTLGLLQSRSCVGWHWFKYRDNDPEDKNTDPSNRDSNKGIVNLEFTPYEPLLKSMRNINRSVYPLIDYIDSHKP